MQHLGDITRISGYDAPVVDVVIGGSPCQGLSVAGKGLGLEDSRSALFLEQIRIIKEMREADARTGRTGQLVRPRFMVWENVPGAFSSNKGEDFRAVLQETIRIAAPDAPDIPLPRKWPLADAWYGDGWSVAYRVLDAQFWGVPQRRRRIALVADFGGHAAPEILFVRKGVCGDTAEGGAPGEEAAAGAGSGAGEAVALRMRGGCEGGGKGPLLQVEKSGTIGCHNNQVIFCAGLKHKAGAKAGSIGFQPEIAPTLSAEQQAAVFDTRGNGDGKTVCTLTGDHQSRVTDYTAIVMATEQAGAEITRGVSPTVNCDHEQPIVAHALRGSGTDPQREDTATYPVTGGRVRRLTPLECERLQGYPDGWTDIGPWLDSKGKRHKESSDSARYKALGNSIALPPWAWVLKRLCACYERPATMASLFDGIGGFPLLWERLNGPGSCLWASEIEEFPMAVTRARFGR
jgi:DNA (cytosine-5)-methyltransferase 1